MDEILRKRLIKEAFDAFRTISDCLSLYYKGRPHMFKPIAGQLRILFCDTNRNEDNSLLKHLYPDLRLIAFRKSEYSTEHAQIKVVAYDEKGNVVPNAMKIKEACYSIVKDKSGIAYPDIDLADPIIYLTLEDWRKQLIDDELGLTVKDIIRTIADKGGGAHIDLVQNDKLKIMKKNTPANIDYQVLFIIALARYTILLARNMTVEWEKEFPGLLITKSKESGK